MLCLILWKELFILLSNKGVIRKKKESEEILELPFRNFLFQRYEERFLYSKTEDIVAEKFYRKLSKEEQVVDDDTNYQELDELVSIEFYIESIESNNFNF